MPIIDLAKRQARGGNLFNREKEKLYDEAMSLKVTNNLVKDENKKLKTQLQQ